MKTCTNCKQTKPSSDYSKYRRAKDGLQSYCKDCEKEYKKEYRGKPESIERRNERNREQTKNNPQKRLGDKVSKETSSTLLGVHPHGGAVSEEYGMKNVGLTSPQYREYIESLWTEGMSWDNYGFGEGKWCIDHIVPKSQFDLTDPELYRKCSHYTNTQPMWYVDNVVKGNRLLD